MFIATLNKTLKSYLFAIIGAEYILRWLPIGTHDWNKFIKPEELEDKMVNLDFSIKEIKGLVFNPILKKWKLGMVTLMMNQKNTVVFPVPFISLEETRQTHYTKLL